MDINDIRAVFTLLIFIAFVGICVWAWSSRRKASFEKTAMQVFDEEDDRIHQQSIKGKQ